MPSLNARPPVHRPAAFVPETAFGTWFLRTYTWEHHVLRVALDDLKRLMTQPYPDALVILDVGCGQGQSFRLLTEAFQPQRIIGIDIHRESLARAQFAADELEFPVELIAGDCRTLSCASESIDIVFCHQTFHHLVHQEASLAEFRRVLKPGARCCSPSRPTHTSVRGSFACCSGIRCRSKKVQMATST